jgi:hypothetical protein
MTRFSLAHTAADQRSAMLLARYGFCVLVVDQVTFPSVTMALNARSEATLPRDGVQSGYDSPL